MSTKSRNAPRRPKRSTAPHPWVIDGIDYGPAIAAVGDLAAWALDLAAKDVSDWPEGKRRVRATKRYVLARVRGRHVRSTPSEDILFTAGLLARIFEADLRLGMSEMVTILDQLGLPTEVVPLMPRPQPSMRQPRYPELVTLRPRPAEPVRVVSPCQECGHWPRYRNAA